MGTGSKPTLKVPSNITKLEKELKEEYERANLAARKEHYELIEKRARDEKERIGRELKRQRAETSNNKNIASKIKSTGKRKEGPPDEAGPSNKPAKKPRKVSYWHKYWLLPLMAWLDARSNLSQTAIS